MGRFFLAVVVLAACGDNLTDEEGAPPPDLGSPGKPPAEARYVPAVCGVREWTSGALGDLNVSLAPFGKGAAMLTVPKAGGLINGFTIDPRMNLSQATKLPIDDMFTSVSASVVNEQVVSTAISASGSIHLDLLDQNFNPQYIVSIPGTQLAEPAFYYAKTNLVMPVGGDDGVWLWSFLDSLEPVDKVQLQATKPVRSLSAAQIGSSVIAAWSTDSECYMMMTNKLAPGAMKYMSSPCPGSRMAVDRKTQAGVMVFDGDVGVRMMPIQGTQFGGDAPLVRPNTRSPRVTFDGTRFWISYIDVRGDVIVGFLDGHRDQISMSLGGPKPDLQAYDMIMIGGTPWVVTLTNDGYTAHQMCAVVEGASNLELIKWKGQNFGQLFE